MGDDEITIRPDGTIDATLDQEYQDEYVAYLREIGREDLIVGAVDPSTAGLVAARRAMATGVYGGPGSGPRPGQIDSPWYHRGKKLERGSLADTVRGETKSCAQFATYIGVLEAQQMMDYLIDAEAEADINEDWAGLRLLNENPRIAAAAKAMSTKNWMKRFDEYSVGGEGASPGADGTLGATVEAVSKEPKMAKAIALVGPVHQVMVMGESRRASGVYFNEIQSIGIMTTPDQVKTLWEGEADAWGNPRSPFGGGAVGGNWRTPDIKSVIRHEFGHHVQSMLDQGRHGGRKGLASDLRHEIMVLSPKSLVPISRYASQGARLNASPAEAFASQGQEAFAETFAAVTHPSYDRDLFPAELHPLLSLMEEVVS